MIEMCVALLFLAVPMLRWLFATRRHWHRVDDLDIRVHVNGIRGKSSVARVIAGVLRNADYPTIAKTTGSAAVVIGADGVDYPIIRTGPATILEQIEIIKRWLTPDIRALVIECMAINPMYQQVCERQIVRSDIGVITNVREDHQDVMGETLPEIAVSLLNTCPTDGILITAEVEPAIVEIMRDTAASLGTELIVVSPAEVTAEDMRGFRHIEFEENVAIGLEVARQLGISRDVAMQGMWSAKPDPGVLRVENAQVKGVQVTWANMFAVNDRESTVAVMQRVNRFATDETITIVILNNRLDRQARALQFADIAARDLSVDKIVTFGAYEGIVTDRLVANGYPAADILNLGDDRDPSWDEIVQEMIVDQGRQHVLLAGMVNIHTRQAEVLLDFFEHTDTAEMLLDHEVAT
jgi:poly-gamma-glutamate synthase PgsB/CapB